MTDPEGRVIASQDYFHSSDGIMLAAVPTRGVPTIYRRIGDVFAYLCVLGLILLAGWAFAHRTQPAQAKQPQTAVSGS